MFTIDRLVGNQQYLHEIISSMQIQYKNTYNEDIDTDDVRHYCITNLYVMIENTKGVNKLIGYFSLSRMDLTNNNIIVRFVTMILSWLQGRIFIYDVYIFPEHRSKGYGIIMINLAIEESTRHFYITNVQLHTHQKALGRFYQKNGFKFIEKQGSLYLFRRSVTKVKNI